MYGSQYDKQGAEAPTSFEPTPGNDAKNMVDTSRTSIPPPSGSRRLLVLRAAQSPSATTLVS